jgi:anaerobic selenocysteine-containing dehydrogenase
MKGPSRSALFIHEEDAKQFGLVHGGEAVVHGPAGKITVKVEVTSDIRRGVVSLPHGFGHGPAADTLRIAGAAPGVNVNTVIDARDVEPLLGCAILNGVPIKIEPAQFTPA